MVCVFEENEITFLLSKDNKMMVNAIEFTPFGGNSEPLQKLKEDDILSSTVLLSTTVGADGKEHKRRSNFVICVC